MTEPKSEINIFDSKCDFCEEPAIFKVKNNDNNWSVSCKKHKKDALESLEKNCTCGHSEKCHNKIDGCMFQYSLDSNATFKDNRGICVCIEFYQDEDAK